MPQIKLSIGEPFEHCCTEIPVYLRIHREPGCANAAAGRSTQDPLNVGLQSLCEEDFLKVDFHLLDKGDSLRTDFNSLYGGGG